LGISQENSSIIKIRQELQYIKIKHTFLIISRSVLIIECEMFQTKVVVKIKKDILCSVTIF